MFDDASLSNPFVNDATFTLTDGLKEATTKLSIVSTSPIYYKTIYLIANNSFVTLQSDVLQFDIYVCGDE